MAKQKQKNILYKEIEKLCIDADISLAQLARELGTTPQSFYKRLDTGKLSYDELSKIAELLGFRFSYTFEKI